MHTVLELNLHRSELIFYTVTVLYINPHKYGALGIRDFLGQPYRLGDNLEHGCITSKNSIFDRI
jgi:hypothetical protein